MFRKSFFLFTLIIIINSVGTLKAQQGTTGQNGELGEFAPPDAFLNGSKHPYYGAENSWDVEGDALGSRFFARDYKREYKRRGQRALLLTIAGKSQEAENFCRESLKGDSEDLEAYFNLVVALTQQNKIDEAVQTVKKAVDMGLPLGRFFAGPRDLLKPLVESEAFKKYAAPFNLNIIHGPMLGQVTDHGASFWVRTSDEVNVQVNVSKNKSMKDAIKSDLIKSDASKDYTAILKVNNLKPATQYFYEVVVNGKVSDQTKIYSFNTYPKTNLGTKFKVAFGGCAGYTPWHERIWDVIKDHDPLAFLWMGDNVYINTPLQQDDIRYCYYQRQSRTEFRNLVSSTSNYAIWDDHDAATDDVWMGPYKDKPVWKMPMLDIFKEQWINPSYGSKEWPACWFNFKIADVEFFMLDGRFYRTDPYDVNPTQLGPAQKAWLLNALKKSTAKFKVIASGTPWAYDSKPGVKDTWNGFHEERTEIFDFLADNNINGVILLSGDRHRTDIRKIERPNGYTLYDWESCRLTNQIVHPVEPGAMFGYNDKQCFGLLTFDTSSPDPSATFDAYSIDNEKVFSMTLKLSELTGKK
ncbi:MAG: alkaline phosphatase D family protein [Ignavibacteriales bacterium]|nr:alkaline phosphatase D family protein [Ignavibacteriales bacterium]